jgi:IclR family transcriptional regulator, KDG regulon repressor
MRFLVVRLMQIWQLNVAFFTLMTTSSEASSRILIRGLALLEMLAQEPTGYSAVEIADRMGLHRTSIYRYLNVLSDAGYITKAPSGRYVLGPKLLELANLSLQRSDLRTVAHPPLVELCSRTGGTVHLCRLDEAEVVYLDKVETSRSLPLYSRIGGRAPAYCTGVGKVLLAYLHPEQLERALRKTSFVAYTEATIIDASALRRRLRQIAEQGYALDCGEHEEGIHCVAVPIFDLASEVVASISVTDLRRKIEGRETHYLQHAQQAALVISRSLGYHELEADSS